MSTAANLVDRHHHTEHEHPHEHRLHEVVEIAEAERTSATAEPITRWAAVAATEAIASAIGHEPLQRADPPEEPERGPA